MIERDHTPSDTPAAPEPPGERPRHLAEVLRHLDWMRDEEIWPNGERYLWTDAFGVVLLVSLYRELGDERYLEEAVQVVQEVDRVLGRPQGIRIGEAPERDGQYFHYLSMWLFALERLGRIRHGYREQAVELVREIHPAFVEPGIGVHWKMEEDLSGPYPGYGFGALDPYHGLVVYRLVDAGALASEIADMELLVEQSMKRLFVTQDLGAGMMLWLTHFAPAERWALLQRQRCLSILNDLWIDHEGYFCRQPGMADTKFAFTNYGISIGLQSVAAGDERIERLHRFFATYRSESEDDRAAITHVMRACSLYPGLLVA